MTCVKWLVSLLYIGTYSEDTLFKFRFKLNFYPMMYNVFRIFFSYIPKDI